MPTSNRKLTLEDIGVLFFILALFFGAWFRISIPETAGFPLNDGGLFYKMIEGLQANHYHLPEYIQYNGQNIPFAYPPLAFYFGAIVSDLFSISVIETLRWLPAIVLIVVIPAVYYLANLILNSRFKAGLASLLYALLPHSLTWLIMGGGVTRSLGQLFMLLTISSTFLLFTKTRRIYLVLSILFGALVLLTHPEATIHTVGIVLLIWIFYSRNKAGVINSLLVAAGILVLTAPWWITMLLRFGLKPYVSAIQTGGHGLNFLFRFFIPFSGEPFFTIIALLAVLGFATRIAQKDYFIPIWFVLPFFIEPRNAQNVSIVPLAILAAIALIELIFPALSEIEGKIANRSFGRLLQGRSEKFLLYYFLICLLLGMLNYSMTSSEHRVSPSAREIFEWIQLQTPVESRFLVLTGSSDGFADWANEWFPALTNRISLTTIQGFEWIDGTEFAKRVDVMRRFQQCGEAYSALACVEDVASEANLQYDYILVVRKLSGDPWGDRLIAELSTSSDHELVHKNDDMVIFKLVK